MAYTRTNWESGVTPLSAGNMNNIEDGIEELNSKLGVTRFSITSNQSAAQYPAAYGYKDSSTGTVRIYFASRYSSNVASGQTHFTIPTAYRPKAGTPITILAYGSDNIPVAGYQTVGTDGKISQGLVGYCRGLIGFGEYDV